jgi:hypothetical protein
MLPNMRLKLAARGGRTVMKRSILIAAAAPTQLMRDSLARGPNMPIDVEWQDERGGQRARYNGPPVTRLLVERAETTSACLRLIDPS